MIRLFILAMVEVGAVLVFEFAVIITAITCKVRLTVLVGGVRLVVQPDQALDRRLDLCTAAQQVEKLGRRSCR